MTRTLICAVAAALAVCPPAVADTVAEVIFDETFLTDLPDGATLSYDRQVTAPEAASAAGQGGAIDVVKMTEADGSSAVLITIGTDGRSRALASMPTVGGNPLVMIFLEGATRAMAELAGGSPFYIRNRIKEALTNEGDQSVRMVTIDGAETEVVEAVLTPFAGDPNRDRMGAFADLELTFTYGAGVPGGIYALDATAPGSGDAVFRDSMTFEAVEGAGQ